jgi:hypothetical protein
MANLAAVGGASFCNETVRSSSDRMMRLTTLHRDARDDAGGAADGTGFASVSEREV